GGGGVVDVPRGQQLLGMRDEMIPVYGALGKVRERIGSGTEYVVPHNHYRAADGAWIAIACTNDRMFERLANVAMEQPGLLTEFGSMDERLRRRDELDARVQEWIGSFDASSVLARLDAAGVPCSRVNSVRDLFEDPHMKARDNVVPMRTPDGTTLWMPGVVPKLSATPGRVMNPGPAKVGEHNVEIYCGRLGLSRDDLTALERKGIV